MRFFGLDTAESTGVVAFFTLVATGFAAWATHVVWVIGKLASDGGVTLGQIVLGVIGTLMPPIGVVHGIMIWCGAGMG